MIQPGKFGGIPSTGSRDIVGTKICHTNADTDADSVIRTETSMSPLTFGGGGGGGGGDINNDFQQKKVYLPSGIHLWLLHLNSHFSHLCSLQNSSSLLSPQLSSRSHTWKLYVQLWFRHLYCPGEHWEPAETKSILYFFAYKSYFPSKAIPKI